MRLKPSVKAPERTHSIHQYAASKVSQDSVTFETLSQKADKQRTT
jgi:hypothetical protein